MTDHSESFARMAAGFAMDPASVALSFIKSIRSYPGRRLNALDSGKGLSRLKAKKPRSIAGQVERAATRTPAGPTQCAVDLRQGLAFAELPALFERSVMSAAAVALLIVCSIVLTALFAMMMPPDQAGDSEG